ncbi:MAG TPA: hypothetical protein VND64_32485 [Pirellulales bacterium]|nr:hypothetical protein [Pirellulales bacterium]
MFSPRRTRITQTSIENSTGLLDDFLLAAACWYLSGLVAFLGFSFGHEVVIRGSTAAARDVGWLGMFSSGSGRRYRQIAEEGYAGDGARDSRPAAFPAYPLMGRALRAATGLPIEAGLLVVSNASLLGAFVLLARYLRTRQQNAPAALPDWTLCAISVFPTGCFFRMCYAESTFLLVAIAAMYGMLRRWPLPALVLLVGLATATRATGVALLGPLAAHIWRDRQALRARAWRLALWLPLACWGLVAFVAFQYAVLGDALASAHAQSIFRVRPAVDWPRKLVDLATFEPLRVVYDPDSPAYWAATERLGVPWFSLWFANPLFFVVAVALTAVGAYKRWVTSVESMFVALMLLIPYVTRAHEMGMQGMGRFVAVAFPIYVVLGQLFSRVPIVVATGLLAIFGFFLAAYSALFAAGYLIV